MFTQNPVKNFHIRIYIKQMYITLYQMSIYVYISYIISYIKYNIVIFIFICSDLKNFLTGRHASFLELRYNLISSTHCADDLRFYLLFNIFS